MGERIVAAAVVYNGVTCSLPAPARHGDIMHTIARHVGEDRWPVDGISGFLTSSGQFVSRIQAARVAVEAGQIDKPKWGAHLYSEDLW